LAGMTRLRYEGKDPENGKDCWSLRLVDLEASLMTSLPDQLEALLANPESNRRVIARLFPISYDDPEEEALSRQLLGNSLLDDRRETVAAFREHLAGGKRKPGSLELKLDVQSVDLWLRFMNDMRLILATDLGIEENLDEDSVQLGPEHPDAPKYALLEYLGGVEAILIEAVRRSS
jgi:hypothetical protein